MKANKLKELVSVAVAFCAAALYAELPDPIAWWTMDEFVEPGLVKDVTGNGYDFQSVGTDVRFEEGPFGLRAIRFGDTQQAWAEVKAPNLQKATERKYTVSLWLRLEKNGGRLGKSVNAFPYLYNNLNGDRVHVTYEGADDLSCYISSTQFAANHGTREQWNFVTLVVDAVKDGETWTTRVVSYVNGASKTDNTKTLAAMGSFASAFMLGNNGLNDTGKRPINAAIADLRIYGSALTAEQVKELQVDSSHPRTPRLVAYWPMDEIVTTGGVRKTPVVGNGFSDMTLGTEITLVPGMHGKALKYGMTNGSYGQTTCQLTSGLSSWSFAAWVRNPYVSNNANVRIYEWVNGNRLQYITADNSLDVYCNVGYGAGAQSGQVAGLVQREGWSHFAVSYDFSAGAGEGEYACNVSFFVNGQKVEALPSTLEPAGNVLTSFIAPNNSTFQLGGMKGATKPNACNGMFDDVCIFSGVLDEDAATVLYNGAKPVDAGVDFAVAADRAVLRGEVVYDLADLVGYPEATNVKWELVSAPAGGESAAIQNPGSPVTEVTLPVEGAYVFKLVSPHRFLPQTDTVQVVRRAKKTANTPPTLTVTAPATAPIETPVTLAVTVTDADGDAVRTSVRKLSGPGGVWFDGAGSSAPRMKVSAVGAYVLRVMAEDGESTVVQDVTITVTESNIAATINDKRIHYWGLNDGAFKDEVSGTAVQAYNSKKASGEKGCFAPGLVGYGFHAEGFVVTDATKTDATGGYSDYRDTDCTLGETATTSGKRNTRPRDQWKSFSLWMKFDSEQAIAYDFDAATLIGVSQSLRIDFGDRNNPNGDRAFSIFQQGPVAGTATDESVNCTVQYFTEPDTPVADRWAHVCVLVDRWSTKNSQIWVDGKKLTISGHSGNADRAGRTWQNTICIGGYPYIGNDHNYGNRSTDGTLRTRAFPGVVDEVQVWNRKLNEAEIAYLAANSCPVVQKRAPSVDAIAETLKPNPKTAFTIDLAVYTDGLPSETDVTYAWAVLDGEAANVTFSDPNVRKPTISIKKGGPYRLQLAATDGALTTYSKPIELDVPPAGLIIIVQ